MSDDEHPAATDEEAAPELAPLQPSGEAHLRRLSEMVDAPTFLEAYERLGGPALYES